MLRDWLCVLFMEVLQPRMVNNQFGVGEGMEADGCGKGGKEEKKEMERVRLLL